MTPSVKCRRRLLPVAGLLALGLAACGGRPGDRPAPSGGAASVAASGGGVTVDVVASDSWPGGFNGAVRITNVAFASPISSFQVVFKLTSGAALPPGWNGVLSGPDASGAYTARNPDSLQYQPINRGASWEVGFSGSGSFGGSTIVSLVVNGQSIPLGDGDTTPPTVSLTASPTSVTAPGNVTLTATASDAQSGVSKVEFLDGTAVLTSCTTTAAPYTCVLAMTAASNGTHAYTARATNGAGLVASSTPAVSVTVNIQNGTDNVFRVNAQGRITRNGTVFPVHCGSWFGLQGRYEPASDPTNPRGAPMELYIGNTFWANGGAGTGRTVASDLAEIKAAGINLVRMPVTHQTLDANDPQGRDPNLKNHASVRVANSRLALEQWLKAADAAGVYVLLDIHSCSNFVDWRKGRLDARPPWVDAKRDNYDFRREDCSCAPDNNPPTVTRVQAYNETVWLQDLKTLAGLAQQLDVHNILGIDIFNEPWDYGWAEWKKLSEDAYQAISSVNPNILVFVEGIGASHGNQLGVGAPPPVATPHGTVNPNWGENLFEAGTNPINIPKDRLVFSPHTYGPSVAVQPQFMDPAQAQCAGLEGDAAGDARCNIVINPTLLKQGWEEHFGYLRQKGYAVVVGEFGGNMEWPKGKASLRDQARYGYLTSTSTDEQWQNTFVDYMISKGIEGCYWSINPESGDTGGWYDHAYDPVSNTTGWGEWRPFLPKKTTLLNRLWSGVP